jgi:ABC-2 type transport system ATP-binding protein
MPTPAILIQDLTKDFSVGLRGLKLRAVDGLNLEVGAGQIYGLLGPNGSGKSTSIKIILGLLRPSSGYCQIFGQPSDSVAARRRVGFLPEAPYFYRYLSGRELVRFYARVCGVPRQGLGQQVNSVLELVGMSEAGNRKVGTYSKGMLQRIGLAQALVHDPDLVILDEPTAGVDPLGAMAIASIIHELKRRGKTILLSSHLLAEMEGLCDRVAILHRGQLMREGRVTELLSQPDEKSFVVKGLDPAGQAKVKQAIAQVGGDLCRIEPTQRSLEALFFEVVPKQQQAKGSVKIPVEAADD